MLENRPAAGGIKAWATKRRLMMGVWVTWLSLVIVYSLLPGSLVPRQPAGGTVEHFIAYFGLGAIPAAVIRSPRRLAALAAMLILLGALLEMGQRLVPGRTCEASDLAANGAGVIVGLIAGLPWRGRVNREAGET